MKRVRYHFEIGKQPGWVARTAIVVMVSQEASGGNPGVSFNSVDLTPVGTAVAGSTLGFYYLNNPATGGAFDLEIDYTSIATVSPSERANSSAS